MYRITKKGQSMLEYAILLCVVVAALLVMQFYVKRAYQGRMKSEADQLSRQYAPGHTTGTTTTTSSGSGTTTTSAIDGTVSSVSTSDTGMKKDEKVSDFGEEMD